MAIINATITSTAAAIYSSSGDNAITTIIICNKSAYVPATPTLNQSLLYLYAAPAGTVTPTEDNLIVNGLPIPAGETVTFDQEKMVLANGDKIFAKTDSLSNLVATVSTLAV
jgi:hypothetical protein